MPRLQLLRKTWPFTSPTSTCATARALPARRFTMQVAVFMGDFEFMGPGKKCERRGRKGSGGKGFALRVRRKRCPLIFRRACAPIFLLRVRCEPLAFLRVRTFS